MNYFNSLQLSLFSFLMLITQFISATEIADQIFISNPYVRATPPGQANSAAFMSIYNRDLEAHRVVSASSPVAEVVELHTHGMDNGMMRMRKVEFINLPSDKKVDLMPGGLHVMLIGLKQPLMSGREITVTVKFEDGSQIDLNAEVKMVMPPKRHGMDMKKEIKK